MWGCPCYISNAFEPMIVENRQLGPCHTTNMKPGVAIGGKQPLITTHEDVWRKATWRGEEYLLSKQPCEVHWKPADCGRSSHGPTLLVPSLQVQLPPCSPTLHPPPRDIPTTTTLLGRGILVSAPKAASKVKLFPTALCRSSSNFVPHSVTWLYLPYRPS